MIGDLEPYLEAEQRLFGTELVLDLTGCDPRVIQSQGRLMAYCAEMVRTLGMRAYGPPLIERFGLGQEKTAGYTIVQLIETSSITGHFSEAWLTGHLNIFSCMPYDVDEAAAFTAGFFGGRETRRWVLHRR